MKRTMKYRRTVREVKPITPELMKHWCKAVGILNLDVERRAIVYGQFVMCEWETWSTDT